ncbi:protein GVQW3-like [Photinus pyralis]|uniref:protein GVQW3-like n=1 Tax=Photinus pyralis TaxID=7054 RepID=UPI00126768F1|nr:protein GVQW3-like [Photinus pyralis]
MSFIIDSAAKCELRSVIRFLCAEGHNAAEIHRRMSKVYGDNFMSDSMVRKWFREFKEGRTDVHDEGGQGRKSVATDDGRTGEELQDMVRTWLDEQAADLYEEGIIKLVPRYEKCLNRLGDYVEK